MLLIRTSCFLILCVAIPARAGLDVAWDSCVTDQGVVAKTLPCRGEGGTRQANLFGTFQLDDDIPNFVALQVSLDIQTHETPSGGFWNFGDGGCNEGHLNFDRARWLNCPSASAALCFPNGSECSSDFSWTSSYIAPNRHRMVGTLLREPSSPVTLETGVSYFAFVLQLFTFRYNYCFGCLRSGFILWNSAVATGLVESGSSETRESILEGPGLMTNCATFNGGDCGATLAHSKTWGQIKSLYR